jgi:hypothetical protein
MNCGTFQSRAVGTQRPEASDGYGPTKIFFDFMSENTLSHAFESEGHFLERSMSIHYDSIHRAVLKHGPEVGSDPILERSRDPSAPLDLPSLRRLRDAKPDRYMPLLRRAWPGIKAELDSGHTLKDVCKSLNADGIAIAYPTLRTTVGRLRREQRRIASRVWQNRTAR